MEKITAQRRRLTKASTPSPSAQTSKLLPVGQSSASHDDQLGWSVAAVHQKVVVPLYAELQQVVASFLGRHLVQGAGTAQLCTRAGWVLAEDVVILAEGVFVFVLTN